MTRRFILLCSALLVCLSALVYAWITQSGAEDTLIRYQRIAAFSPREMTYHSAVHPLLDDGVILYHPTFPDLPVRMNADKLLFKATPAEITVRLTGLKVDFAQTLLERDGAGIVDTFRHFQAPDDFLIKPIETLVLLKQDTFQGSLTLTLRPHGTDILFRAEAFKGRDSVVQILGTIVIPTQSVGRLWGWTDGTIQSLTVQVQDVALLRRAAAYLHSVRQPLPEALTRALNTRTPLAFTIDLARPVPVLSLFQQGSAYVPTHNTETTF